MTVRAVFFDMGGTLETFWYTPEFRLQATPALRECLQVAGIDLSLTDQQLCEVVSAGWDCYHKWSIESLTELPTERVLSEYIFADLGVAPNKLAKVAQDLMFFLETHYYFREMRPEVPAVLETVKEMGLKIGLISNVCSRNQVPASLKQYGIHHYFDPIVLSSEYGRRKPDPSIFHYAARLANSPTSECIYIGDRISRDIVGAKRAGYQLAIQIEHNFDHGESDEGATPDLILENMTELLDILRLENTKSTKNYPQKDRPTHQIRAILFDAEGVLYCRSHKNQGFTAFLIELGINEENIPTPEVDHLRNQAFIGQITFDRYKEGVLRLYGITQPSLISRGIQIINEEYNEIQFFNGVLETLNALKNKKYYLGIVTDTAQPLYVKINKLERGGIGSVWDSIISSQEVGVRKPDPKIYQLALQQLGINSDQAVFVGHKASELDGARNVGLKTVAINYDTDAKADFYIEKFTDLMNLPILR